MPETATIHVQEVKTKQVNGKTLWEVKDGNAKIYATFKPDLGNAATGFEGGPARIEFTEKQTEKNGTTYTNRYLEAIAAAPPPAKGTPEYQPEDVDWDSKERRDFRSRAWAQAITAMQHTGSSDETPKRVFERIKPLAHAIYADVCGDFAQPPPAPQDADFLGVLDDDVPF